MAPAIPPPFKEEKETGRTRPETARTMTSEPKQIRIKTADEFALAATVFPGEDNDGAKRCAIMSSAMGVKRGFYVSFARFLSKEGITAEWTLYMVGLLPTVVVTLYVTRKARAALNQQIQT